MPLDRELGHLGGGLSMEFLGTDWTGLFTFGRFEKLEVQMRAIATIEWYRHMRNWHCPTDPRVLTENSQI